MSKTMKRCYYDKLTFENLYKAYKRACKNKRKKKEVINFELNLETNLIRIYNDLYNLTYTPSRYRTFTIHEPKERIINALPFYDRVIHQFYVEEFIKPFYVKRFIQDTYACIENRGTHAAVLKLQFYLNNKYIENNNFYVLKCDIKKFFFNINKDILFNILQKNSKDKYFLKLSKIIIYSFKENYIPIGNYTSQYYANIYLNELDHFIKDQLNIKYYIRYMDDFILLLNNKDECIYYLNKIKLFLNDNLNLELNNKTKYFKFNNYIDFCGYLVHLNILLPRKRNVRKVFKLINNYDFNYDRFYKSMNSYLAYLEYTTCYSLKREIFKKINDIKSL